jgi:hypothetical protein
MPVVQTVWSARVEVYAGKATDGKTGGVGGHDAEGAGDLLRQ